MRLLFTPIVLAGLTACIGGADEPDRTPDTDTDPPLDTDPVDTDDGTDPEDLDGDGFTPAQGDCDDGDVFVNPGWNELNQRADDGKDNDCDGRVDEVFKGLMVLDVDGEGTTGPQLKWIDTLGTLKGTVPLSEPVDGLWSDESLDNDGWVLLGGETLSRVAPNGTVTGVLQLRDDLDWGDDAPLTFVGLAAHHRDEAYYISAVDRLLRLTWDGSSWTVTTVAEWSSALVDETHDATVAAVAADRFDDRLALIGLDGAFGWFDPATGAIDWRLTDDPLEPAWSLTMAHGRDNDGIFVLGTEAATQTVGLWRWEDDTASWAEAGVWPNPEDYPPSAFTIEDETGDFYLSANGGWDQTVWRMVADGSYTGQLFTTNQEFRFHKHRAPLVLWE